MISLCKASFAVDKSLRLIEARRNWMRLTKRYLQSAEYIKIRHSDSQGFQSVQIESAYVYLFDCFAKSMDPSENHSKNDDMILKLRKITPVDPIIDPTVEIDHTVDEITASGKETKSVWEINNLETPLQCAKQTSSASKLESDLDLTRKIMKVGKIFWIDIDKLFFFSLTFCLTVDVKGVAPEEIMTTILNGVRPFGQYLIPLMGFRQGSLAIGPLHQFLSISVRAVAVMSSSACSKTFMLLRTRKI